MPRFLINRVLTTLFNIYKLLFKISVPIFRIGSDRIRIGLNQVNSAYEKYIIRSVSDPLVVGSDTDRISDIRLSEIF